MTFYFNMSETISQYPKKILFQCIGFQLGVPSFAKYVVFLNIVQKPVDLPPPLCFEHCGANFFDGFHKKCVNVCRDKIRQNNA